MKTLKLAALLVALTSLAAQADQKVSARTAITGAGVSTSDLLGIVDVSAGTAGSKKITIAEFVNAASFTAGDFLAANAVEFAQVNGLTAALGAKADAATAVTLAGVQTITGGKVFSDAVTFDSVESPVVFSSASVFDGTSTFNNEIYTYSPVYTTSGNLKMTNGLSFDTSLACVAATANRTITFPNATGTILLADGDGSGLTNIPAATAISGVLPAANGGTGVNNATRTLTVNTNSGTLAFSTAASTLTIPGSGTAALRDVANTFTAAQTISAAGATAVPALKLSGAWLTSSATTTVQALIESGSLTSNTWHASGTGLGVNGPSGFVGNLLDLQVNGVSKAKMDYNGDGTFRDINLGVGRSLVLRSGVTLSSSNTGLMTLSAGLQLTPNAQTATTAAVSLTTTATKLTTTAPAQAITLANGTEEGQIKIITHVATSGGGTAVLTPATKTGYTTITFNAVTDTVTIQYYTTIGWVIIASRGVVIA